VRAIAAILDAVSRENVETTRRAYEQFAAGDLQAASAVFAPDAEMADAGGLGIERGMGTVRGPEGFIRTSQEMFDAFEDYTVESDELIDAGDFVIVSVRITGRGRGSGAPLDVRLVHLWEFRDRKVVRSEVYRTVEQARVAAGRQGG
jgi:ketosteroid isomerase-like protein